MKAPSGWAKTSLARRLCTSLDAEAVLEQAADNPFLERFYRNPRAGALPTQLYFLFQRAQQLCALKQQDLFAPVRVADYLLDKDRLFARVTLDDAEYALYEQVYAKLDIQPPKPDLVVYLQAPVDVLLERISKRGIDYEQHIERQYLERLNEAYARFFHEFETGAAADRKRGCDRSDQQPGRLRRVAGGDPAHEARPPLLQPVAEPRSSREEGGTMYTHLQFAVRTAAGDPEHARADEG